MTTTESSSDNKNNNGTSKYQWSLVEQCYLLLHSQESSTSSSDNGTTTTTNSTEVDGPGGGRFCGCWWEELPVGVVEVSSVQDLGTIVTLRFLEWCIDHPNGVAVLPTTGAMASIFLQTLSRFRASSSSSTSSFQEQVQQSMASLFQRSVQTLSTGEATTTTDTTTKSIHFQNLQQQLLDKMTQVPDTSGISLVLLQEFFPMLPTDPKSGCWILRESYGKVLQIPSTQIHVMDLVQANIFSTEELTHLIQYSTRSTSTASTTTTTTTTPSFWDTAISKVEAYCQDYEQTVRSKLLLGDAAADTTAGCFYLDCMGLDGSIGMNQPKSSSTTSAAVSLTTTTRLVPLNYCTAASLATDLGGIGPARSKRVMMPLSWETWTRSLNPHATVIVLASGEGLAQMVQESLEENQETTNQTPLSNLYGHGGARLYLTSGAASLLSGRRTRQLANLDRNRSSSGVNPIVEWATHHVQETTGLDQNVSSSSSSLVENGSIPPHLIEPSSDYALVESFLYQMSLFHKVKVEELTVSHIKNTAPEWLQQPATFKILQKCAACRLRQKVQGGLDTFLTQGQTLLHTAPHHDDIMLSYHAVMHELLGRPNEDTNTKKDNSGGTTMAIANGNPSETNETAPIVTMSNNKRKLSAISLPPHNEDTLEDAASSNTNGTTTTEQQLGEQTNGNTNHFAYLTSGFNSVPDEFLSKWIHAVRGAGSLNGDGYYDYDYALVTKLVSNGELQRDYNVLLSNFRQAFFANEKVAQQDIENIIFLRKVAEVFDIPLIKESTENDGSVGDCDRISHALIVKMELIRSEYLGEETSSRQGSSSVASSSTAQSSSAMAALLQCARRIKGCMRETEVDRVWALSRMPIDRVHHLRSKFYVEKKPPTTEDDAMPVARLIRQLQPSMISVAFDPEGTGPDTHYKVLQIVADAVSVCVNGDDENFYLKESVKKRLLVWGYRNVWFTFSPSDATLLLPASSADLDLLHQTFVSCFTTQKEAAYPSPYYDGPFSGWSCTLQRLQMEHMKILLGESFFREHENPRIRNAEGFVFIKAMTVSRFLREVQGLKSTIEGSLN
jgi:hypothetical protein